jgi:hypothetical protein
MGYHVVTEGVPTATVRYGPVGTPEPELVSRATGPATAGPLVATPEEISGGNTTVIGSPHLLLGMPAPLTEGIVASGGQTPLETQPSYWSHAVVADQIYVTPPSNALVTPRIRPPKYIDPGVLKPDMESSNAGAYGRGGHPRGANVPQGWVTASPQVVTRWSTYGTAPNAG